MNFSNVSFPHPVLGIADDILSEIKVLSTINLSQDDYVIKLDYICDNDDLLKLIECKKAEYVCEVTCTDTVYREAIKGSNSKMEFNISRKSVKKGVEFQCLLVAKENIDSYSNSKFHSDYAGFNFSIDKGDVLAHFGGFSFNADIKYEKLKAVSSFMDIVEREDLTYSNIDLKKNKIEIQLPSDDYNIFRKDTIGKVPVFASVFHSSIVLNALLIALYNFEEHKEEYQWAKVIDYRLKNEKEFESLSIEEKENIPEIAQCLLGNPFKRLLNGMEIISHEQEN